MWSCFLLHKFKMMASADAFFIFSRIWFSGFFFFWGGGVGGEKKKKNGPKWNDKKKLSHHSVSQELYLIWLWFLVLMCKMMISPAILFHFFFQNFDFQVFQSLSINAKTNFWVVPHLLHMCVILFDLQDLQVTLVVESPPPPPKKKDFIKVFLRLFLLWKQKPIESLDVYRCELIFFKFQSFLWLLLSRACALL